MSVYYKFNSELNYSYVEFDGLHIAVSDLKKAILHQKRLGKTADFDLLISNAQTKEEYKEEKCLIPKNTSLIVARIPLSNQNKKSWDIAARNSVERAPQNPSAENINHDITRMNGTEDDKIQAMMMQSTVDYDPTNYQRVRGNPQMGDVPANYRCHKCHKPGHWIKNCPLNPLGEKHQHFKTRPESKKMTGIPRSLRDAIAENQEPVQSQFIEEKKEIPEDLVCAICKGIFKDAVMTPCCGSSFCDECVRTALLESEENECPDCKEKGTSPGSLIPNRFLRNAVSAFLAESSNVLNRDSQKRILDEVLAPEEVEEESVAEQVMHLEEVALQESEEIPVFENQEEVLEIESEALNKHLYAEKDSESDDDDNITVTVPPAHQQSRGASFRDSRMRRLPSQSVGEFSESYSHSSSSKNHHEEGESYEEESGRRHHSSSKRGNHYESSQPQGIATLGDDKGSRDREHYREHSSRPPQNISHEDSYQQHLQHPQHFNPGQHAGMMTQMQPHSMYPQGPYHQPSGQYYPQNQIRYDHQGNYQLPIRLQQNAPTMMRPAMHDNYGMRHQRPPINNLANAVTHNIQQRYGTGFIDDPLEAFNRIMREKELRKEQRFRRSPIHTNERRSRSFERKRSPMHQFSPENRRQKNYAKPRKRSRSFKSKSKSYSRSRSRERSARGKSRSYSPRYRRKENVQVKDRRDDRHRSPARRGNYQNNRNSRGNYKGDSSSKPSFRDGPENLQYHENTSNQHDKIDEYPRDENAFDIAAHNLDEQPPPPGDESETILQAHKQRDDDEMKEKEAVSNEKQIDSSEVNGSKKADGESRKEDRHHHHKKSRVKNYETSSDDKKPRDKKKRKKSREHEKKKNKKDRKSRPDKEKEKKTSSKTGSVEKTPEVATSTEQLEKIEASVDKIPFYRETSKEEVSKSLEVDDHHHTPEIEDEKFKDPELKLSEEKQNFRRSDSILDINPNVDLDLDEWAAPEVSKWERDENKLLLDANEIELGNGDHKKNPEERVTSEIIKRAENAIFARAISAIRPIENKKLKSESDVTGSKKESSPMVPPPKKSDSSKDTKLQAFQVTVPANDSGTRSIEVKPSESTRDATKQRKSPLRTSIKNRLGVKIVEKKSRSKSPSRSPKRRLLSDCTKVVSRSSRDVLGRSQGGSTRDRHSSPDRRNKQLSSFIRVEPRDTRHGRINDRRRSRTPDDRRTIKRTRMSRSRSKSRHDTRRHDQRSNNDKSYAKPREPPRSDEKNSRPVEQQSSSDLEKSKAKGVEAPIKKRSREPSSSSSSTTASSSGSQKHSKRHSKHKVSKKKSRSPSAESNGNSKRKKSKKEKKAKKKKKSRK